MDCALVTGATSGIGLAIARALLLKEGCFVYLNYANDRERAERVCAQLESHRGRFELLRADMSSYDGANSIMAELKCRDIGLRYLVLNFGLTDRSPFGSITVEGWERVMRANLNVPFFLIQSLHSAGILAAGASILCISSLMASIPHSASVSYGVSKAALSALCQNMVKFLAPSGIRVNAIEPGFIDTPWQSEKTPDHKKRIQARTALGRFGEAREIADMSLAVLKNPFLTGTVVPMGGGYGFL